VLDDQHAWTASASQGSIGSTGNSGQNVLHYVVSRTADGGVSWQSIDLSGNYPETRPALSFVDSRHGYLLIAPERFSTASVNVFTTSDGGASWQDVGTSAHTQLQYGRMFSATPDGTLWAGAEATATGAGNWPLLEMSRDGGASWRSVSLPGRDVLANGDFLLAPPRVVGKSVIVATDQNGPLIFYRSADGGQTWQVSRPIRFDGQAYGVPAIIDATHWLVPAQTGLTIWATDNAGASWRELTTRGLPGIGPIRWLGFADQRHGAALTSLGNTPAPDGLLVTKDGGRTWQPAALPSSVASPTAMRLGAGIPAP
jgi:photosystem II stability/assembly factor-like uncharacterized protein